MIWELAQDHINDSRTAVAGRQTSLASPGQITFSKPVRTSRSVSQYCAWFLSCQWTVIRLEVPEYPGRYECFRPRCSLQIVDPIRSASRNGYRVQTPP